MFPAASDMWVLVSEGSGNCSVSTKMTDQSIQIDNKQELDKKLKFYV